MSTYVWRVVIDGEPTPLTLTLEQTRGEDAEAVRRIVQAAERHGIALEPEYLDDAVEVEVELTEDA
jgi:hypothetical protein